MIEGNDNVPDIEEMTASSRCSSVANLFGSEEGDGYGRSWGR